MAFKINGIEVKKPSSFKIERYNVTNMERLSNADMTGDLIAKKLKFYFTYETLSAAELENILSAIWEGDSLFYPFEYEENGVSKKATVYSGSIPTELAHVHGSLKNAANWVWKGVSFNLIER